MSYGSPDPYYQPEAFGLTPFGGLDEPDLSYEFHQLDVWLHEDGTLYWGMDSGCSCPSPYEGINSLDQLEKVQDDWSRFEDAVKGFAYDPRWKQGPDPLAFEKVDLLRRCSRMVNDPDFTELKKELVEMERDLSRR